MPTTATRRRPRTTLLRLGVGATAAGVLAAAPAAAQFAPDAAAATLASTTGRRAAAPRQPWPRGRGRAARTAPPRQRTLHPRDASSGDALPAPPPARDRRGRRAPDLGRTLPPAAGRPCCSAATPGERARRRQLGAERG